MSEVTKSVASPDTATMVRTRLRARALVEQEELKQVVKTPLWRVRLGLAIKALRTNWTLFAENPIGLVGLSIIAFFAFLAILHPILMRTVWSERTYDPVIGFDYVATRQPAPPSLAHLLGTDPLGRDILSQLMFSTRNEFALGVIAALATVIIATTVGAVSAYYGGFVDAFFMRVADVLLMMPFVSVLVVLSAILKLDMIKLAIVIGILSGFGGTTIIIKSQALSVKVKPFIEAARVAGGNNRHIIFTHILPNLLPLSFLYMMFTVTSAIFLEAVLSFFGLMNIRMSWGIMIHTAQTAGYLLAGFQYWWLLMPAGLSITLLCAAFYLVGRALDEVVNPRLRKR